MTNFNWLLDGSIVGVYLLITMIAGLMVRKYVGKVEHFLVAGREMDLFLGIASLAATEFGIVTCMYTAQNGFQKGFAGATPGILMAAAMLIVGVTGFCIKPLRDSGVMTLPELIDKKFGPNIRWASGVVIVLGGLLNMGVFLRVGGQFLVLVSGMDVRYLEVMMTALLIGVAVYTILGGMLSVLVTDFLQFIVMSVGLIAVTILILMNVGWESLVTTVEKNYGAGGFNPFLGASMGWGYVLAQGLLNTAAVLTWQTTIARVLAAKDTDTGRKIYSRTSFFFVCRFLIPGIWGIAALVHFGPIADDAMALEAMPKYLAIAVPSGLMGILIAAMLAADMSTDSSYLQRHYGSVSQRKMDGEKRLVD
jgi:solute:Na+ symporter, SSS family